MNTTTHNLKSETHLSHQRRWRMWLVVPGLAPVFLCIGCLFLYIVTSPCGLSDWWYNLIHTVPTVPSPPNVVRLSAREPSGKPILGIGQRNTDLYGELYIAASSPDRIVAFYQAHDAKCYQSETGSAAYWSCDLAALPYGAGHVDIFPQEAYRLKPDVHDVGIESYHLERPIPNQGTILRTFVVWCVDP